MVSCKLGPSERPFFRICPVDPIICRHLTLCPPKTSLCGVTSVAREITCPGCRSTYKIPEKLQDKPVRITCKKCDRTLTAAAGNGKPASKIKATRDEDSSLDFTPKSS